MTSSVLDNCCQSKMREPLTYYRPSPCLSTLCRLSNSNRFTRLEINFVFGHRKCFKLYQLSFFSLPLVKGKCGRQKWIPQKDGNSTILSSYEGEKWRKFGGGVKVTITIIYVFDPMSSPFAFYLRGITVIIIRTNYLF